MTSVVPENGHNQTFAMTPENYPVVGRFKNETVFAMTLYLEMLPEEVILEPGDEVELRYPLTTCCLST